MLDRIRAHFDGKAIVPDEALDLPFNQPLEIDVRLVEQADGGSGPQPDRRASVTSLAFFGMWAARGEMADSARWVRDVRRFRFIPGMMVIRPY